MEKKDKIKYYKLMSDINKIFLGFGLAFSLCTLMILNSVNDITMKMIYMLAVSYIIIITSNIGLRVLVRE